MPARKRLAPPKKSRKEIRALVKQGKLSRELYRLPLDVKILIFQFAVLANMAVWVTDHATKFRETLILFTVSPNPPVPICRKRPFNFNFNFRHKVNIPYEWVKERVTEERYDQLECRDWGTVDMCKYWHHPKCWCKDCYDVRDLSRVYQETMRHWFLKYQGIKTEWFEQLKDKTVSEEKRDLKLGYIYRRQDECIDEAPSEFWEYLHINYTWSDTLWAYVPK